VYVAEPSGGGLVAKQRQVVLGTIVGNDSVVQSGLKAGEQVITGGIQKIADGAPVQILPARGRQ
jgi:multidrug efflux pump subunit AcrA (membrane-fusion protein)